MNISAPEAQTDQVVVYVDAAVLADLRST